MKSLRIAKMVSVFSKRSMLACMIAGGMLSLNSCDNKNLEPNPTSTFNPIPGEVINTDNSQLDEIAKALAASMGEESVRTLIKTEALKKFDGDFDILYQNIDDRQVGGKTLNAVLNENGSKNTAARATSISQLAAQMPLLNISVPVNIEKWNTGSFEPLVVMSPSSFVQDEMKLTTVKAYDKNGKVHYLDAKKAPDFPVIVVGLNERTTFKNGKIELKTNLVFPKKTSSARSNEEDLPIEDPNGGGSGPGGGGTLGADGCPMGSSANSIPGGGQNGVNYPNGSEDYIEWLYCQDGNAWEGWFDGGPEFYFQGGGADGTASATSRFTQNNIPFYVYNYRDLQGTWGYNCTHTSLGRWLPKHGDIVTHIWYEEDSGDQRTGGQNIKVKYNGQENETNFNRIILENDDFVAKYEMYRDNGPCYIYGSNTFKYKVTRRFL